MHGLRTFHRLIEAEHSPSISSRTVVRPVNIRELPLALPHHCSLLCSTAFSVNVHHRRHVSPSFLIYEDETLDTSTLLPTPELHVVHAFYMRLRP